MTDVIVELAENAVTVELAPSVTFDVELLTDSPTVEIIPIGFIGPPGPTSGFSYEQTTASSTWTIAHNLGYRPSVGCFTTGGQSLVGTVTHLSENTLTVTFAVPIAGVARLS